MKMRYTIDGDLVPEGRYTLDGDIIPTGYEYNIDGDLVKISVIKADSKRIDMFGKIKKWFKDEIVRIKIELKEIKANPCFFTHDYEEYKNDGKTYRKCRNCPRVQVMETRYGNNDGFAVDSFNVWVDIQKV